MDTGKPPPADSVAAAAAYYSWREITRLRAALALIEAELGEG